MLRLVPDWAFHFWAWAKPHDPLTWKVFLFLGAAQTIVAVYGVCLAVEALPDIPTTSDVATVTGTQHNPRIPKRVHYAFAVIVGIILFALTGTIGVLNDKSQFQASEDARNLKGELGKAQKSLATVDGKMDIVSAKLQEPPSAQRNTDVKNLIAGIRSDVVHGLQSTAAIPHPDPSTTPLPTLAPVSPQPSTAAVGQPITPIVSPALQVRRMFLPIMQKLGVMQQQHMRAGQNIFHGPAWSQEGITQRIYPVVSRKQL